MGLRGFVLKECKERRKRPAQRFYTVFACHLCRELCLLISPFRGDSRGKGRKRINERINESSFRSLPLAKSHTRSTLAHTSHTRTNESGRKYTKLVSFQNPGNVRSVCGWACCGWSWPVILRGNTSTALSRSPDAKVSPKNRGWVVFTRPRGYPGTPELSPARKSGVFHNPRTGPRSNVFAPIICGMYRGGTCYTQ